jgi:hypothetical protein
MGHGCSILLPNQGTPELVFGADAVIFPHGEI